MFSPRASFLRRSTSVRLWGKRSRRHSSSRKQQQSQPNVFAVAAIVVALGRSLYFVSSQSPPSLSAQLVIIVVVDGRLTVHVVYRQIIRRVRWQPPEASIPECHGNRHPHQKAMPIISMYPPGRYDTLAHV